MICEPGKVINVPKGKKKNVINTKKVELTIHHLTEEPEPEHVSLFYFQNMYTQYFRLTAMIIK